MKQPSEPSSGEAGARGGVNADLAATDRNAELGGTRDAKMVPLNLSDGEIDDLVAFLETLTGTLEVDVAAPPTVPAPSGF